MKSSRMIFAFVCAVLTVSAIPGMATNISVTPTAAIGPSNFGLEVDLSLPTSNAFVQDNTPGELGNVDNYWAQFSIRQLTSMAPGSAHTVFRARRQGGPIFQAQMVRQVNGDYVLWPLVFTDAGSMVPGRAVFVEPQGLITFEWSAATAPGSNDGVFRMWKGSNLRFEITDIDNDTHMVEQVQLGSFGGLDDSSSGEIHFDDFASARTSLLP